MTTTARDPATRHVIDRCPSCGVEHDVRAAACEACDTPLRPWCRAHSRETGWLDGPACTRCAAETRPRPVPASRIAAAPAAADGRVARAAHDVVRRREPPPFIRERPIWAQALGQVAGKTSLGAAGGGVAGWIGGLLTGTGALAAAWDTAFVFGLTGLAIGGLLGVAIILDARAEG